MPFSNTGLAPLYAKNVPYTDDADPIVASITTGLSKVLASAEPKPSSRLDEFAKVGFETNIRVNGEGLMSTASLEHADTSSDCSQRKDSVPESWRRILYIHPSQFHVMLLGCECS